MGEWRRWKGFGTEKQRIVYRMPDNQATHGSRNIKRYVCVLMLLHPDDRYIANFWFISNNSVFSQSQVWLEMLCILGLSRYHKRIFSESYSWRPPRTTHVPCILCLTTISDLRVSANDLMIWIKCVCLSRHGKHAGASRNVVGNKCLKILYQLKYHVQCLEIYLKL